MIGQTVFASKLDGSIRHDTLALKPLDVGLNIAVNTIAGRLFPTGFDVGDDAPQSYEELCELLNKPHARMKVWGGASDFTIFADPETNYAFRAWHDWCHWKGGYPFTREGEYEAFKMQGGHLIKVYGFSPQTHRWYDILHAEIIGQFDYAVAHNGEFPANQRDFVERCLAVGTARAINGG